MRTHFRKKLYLVFGAAVMPTFTVVVPSVLRIKMTVPPTRDGS